MATMAPPATSARADLRGRQPRRVIATLDPPEKAGSSDAVSLTGLTIGALSFAKQLHYGIGVNRLHAAVFWGTYITTFVFWVGIAHSGTLISAILFLFRSGWRAAVYRAAEAMTVFAVMTAGLFPVLHLGRAWFAYWVAPYPNIRGLWSNFKSPLVWDIFAISTYLTVSATFLVMGLIPDVAALRDQATGWRKKGYSLVALGWRNSNTEWRHFMRMYLFLAGLSTPLVLSVHSVVSWDFAMAIVPGGTPPSSPRFVPAPSSPAAHGDHHPGAAAPYFKLRAICRSVTSRTWRSCACSRPPSWATPTSRVLIAWYGGNEFERTSFTTRVRAVWWATWTMTPATCLSRCCCGQKVRTSCLAVRDLDLINIGIGSSASSSS